MSEVQTRRIVILCKNCENKNFWEYNYLRQNVDGNAKFMYKCKNCQAQSSIVLSKRTGLLVSVDLLLNE